MSKVLGVVAIGLTTILLIYPNFWEYQADITHVAGGIKTECSAGQNKSCETFACHNPAYEDCTHDENAIDGACCYGGVYLCISGKWAETCSNHTGSNDRCEDGECNPVTCNCEI